MSGLRAVSLTAFLMVPMCVRAGTKTLRPGEYITEGGWGVLTISTSEDRTIFSIEVISPTGHSCSLDGEIRNLRAHLEMEGEDKACEVSFQPKADGVEVSHDGITCHRYYCGARADFEGEYLRPKRASGSRVTFETRTFERREGPGTVSFSYPVIKAAPSEALQVALTEEIDKFLIGGEQAATPEAVADAFLAESRRARQEFPEETGVPWNLSRTAKITYQDTKVVSLRLDEWAFTGNPRGDSSVRYAIFDPATGRRLGLADLIKPDGMARLLELGERELRKKHEIRPGQSLEDAGFTFEGGRFALGQQMAVLAEGLVIYYNLYEIAPYVMGTTEIIIPRRELAPIAKPGGPFDPGAR